MLDVYLINRSQSVYKSLNELTSLLVVFSSSRAIDLTSRVSARGGKSTGRVQTGAGAGKSTGRVQTGAGAGKSTGRVRTGVGAGKTSESALSQRRTLTPLRGWL